ncbi:PAS domain S-box protein [Mucilaginibacter sp.]|jgi:PAS domain S-box-containing protein|uniref:PAS domain S-box protein n=1 Tax=Mucilaginibacter sp. TaxID=1882438 RepID=UPI003563DB53
MHLINEDDLRNVISNAPVGICILDAATQIIEIVNPRFLKLMARPGENLLGKNYGERFPKPQADEAAMSKALGEGRPYTVHQTEHLQAGYEQKEAVLLSLLYSPVRNREGRVTRIAVWLLENAVQAVNEELAATNEELAAANEEYAAVNEELAATNEELLDTQVSLRQSEQLFRSIALNIPGSLIVVIDRSHRYIAIEGDLMEKMGFVQRDYEGKHPSEISPERYESFRHLYDRLLAGEKFSVERRTETEEIYIVHFVPLKNEAGETTQGLIITLDITGIKQAEEKSAKLAAIVESSDDAIVSKTLESVITSWNASAEHMFGYTAGEMIGQTIYKIIPPDRQEEEPAILARLKKGERVHHFETKRLTKGGQLLDVSLTISPVKDKEGRIIGLSKIARDITEKKMEEQRKSDFIGMVSHELKTPLTSLSAIIQMAHINLRHSDDPFLPGAMEKATRLVKKMAIMINGFLNVSRLEAGQLFMEKQPFELDVLLREIIEESRLTASNHNFTLEECDRITVYADRDKVSSVISNLIGNAVKYSQKGRRVDIHCHVEEEMAIVSIRDEGLGIKPEDTDRIFDRYYRAKSDHTRHISGFGVGLYLSSEIIRRHRGKIWVESKEGKGSTFYFSLPLAGRSSG